MEGVFYSEWGCWSSSNAKYVWTKYIRWSWCINQQHGTWRLLQAVCLVEEWNKERSGKGEPLIAFADISQTVTRMVQSTEDTKVPNSNLRLKLLMCCNYSCRHIIRWYQVAGVSFKMLVPLLEVYRVANWGWVNAHWPNLGINIHWQAYGTWFWPTFRKIFVLIVAHWNIRISIARLFHTMVPGLSPPYSGKVVPLWCATYGFAFWNALVTTSQQRGVRTVFL